jgi:hypothetical protein
VPELGFGGLISVFVGELQLILSQALAMLKRLLFLCVLPLFLSTNAIAQNVNDFLQMFGGVMQQAMRQAAQAEWHRLPASELSCLDQSLRQQGASVDD